MLNNLINNIYTQKHIAENISSNDKVAITGMGLTSMDIISLLTLGKGGKYITDENSKELIYLPSGNEPKLYLFSKSGLPYRARPNFNLQEKYVPIFFTKENLTKIRAEKKCYKLSLENDVLPLLFDEMLLRFYSIASLVHKGEEASKIVKNKLSEYWNSDQFKEYVNHLSNIYGVFNPKEVLNLCFSENSDSKYEYEDEVKKMIIEDLVEAEKGVTISPLKSALELLRDLRNEIRFAVDFAGLDSNSHSLFLKKYVPIVNRTVAGPQKERMKEVLALLKSGILSLPFGPNPQVTYNINNKFRISSVNLKSIFEDEVDYLILGFVEQPKLSNSNNTLIKNLYKSGRLKYFYNESELIGGVDLNTNLQPINHNNEIEKNIWVMGPLSEGVKYYNHYVPTPYAQSPSIIDAENCVTQLLNKKVNGEIV